MLDRRIKAAWAAHPQHLVIDNATDFNGKLARTDEAILAAARAFFEEGDAETGAGGGGDKGQEEGEGAKALRSGNGSSAGNGGTGGGARQQGQQGAAGCAPGRA